MPNNPEPYRPLRGAEEETLLASVALEMRHHAPMEMVFRPETAFALAGLLQLALRHPGASAGHAAFAGRAFIAAVNALFADAPATREVLSRGDEPERDR